LRCRRGRFQRRSARGSDDRRRRCRWCERLRLRTRQGQRQGDERGSTKDGQRSLLHFYCSIVRTKKGSPGGGVARNDNQLATHCKRISILRCRAYLDSKKNFHHVTFRQPTTRISMNKITIAAVLIAGLTFAAGSPATAQTQDTLPFFVDVNAGAQTQARTI